MSERVIELLDFLAKPIRPHENKDPYSVTGYAGDLMFRLGSVDGFYVPPQSLLERAIPNSDTARRQMSSIDMADWIKRGSFPRNLADMRVLGDRHWTGMLYRLFTLNIESAYRLHKEDWSKFAELIDHLEVIRDTDGEHVDLYVLWESSEEFSEILNDFNDGVVA